MPNITDLNTKETGVSEFVDSKKRLHIVKHSVILTDLEKGESENQISEDLYRIFTKEKIKHISDAAERMLN